MNTTSKSINATPPINTSSTTLPPLSSTDTTTTTTTILPKKSSIWWIFMPYEFFFSLFPDFTPYFSIFYFSIYKYILAFGIAVMIYSYRTKQLSFLSILMIYVGIREPAWYLFYLYVLLWIGIIFLFQMMYETPPWKVNWFSEIDEMKKKGDASPLDEKEDDDKTAITSTKPSRYLDKIFEDVDSDDDDMMMNMHK